MKPAEEAPVGAEAAPPRGGAAADLDVVGDGSFPASDPPQAWTWDVPAPVAVPAPPDRT